MSTVIHPNLNRLAALSPQQVHQFLVEGYVKIPGAFPRELVEQAAPLLWDASPFTSDPATWTAARTVVPKSLDTGPFEKLYTPTINGATADLLGQGRFDQPRGTGYLLFNLPGFDSPPWTMIGGHVDGNFFHHHLDSREQGVVLLFLFSDIDPAGGGTAIRPGSHLTTARLLADAEPAGLSCADLCRLAKLASDHLPQIEVTGHAGDVVIMHPFTFHGSSSNLGQRPRIASNMCVGLREKMNLARPDPADYSPVELAIVNALSRRVG